MVFLDEIDTAGPKPGGPLLQFPYPHPHPSSFLHARKSSNFVDVLATLQISVDDDFVKNNVFLLMGFNMTFERQEAIPLLINLI